MFKMTINLLQYCEFEFNLMFDFEKLGNIMSLNTSNDTSY